MRDPFRVADGIGNRNGDPLRYAQEIKALHARRVDHGFQVLDPGFESHLLRPRVGKPVATLVIANEFVLCRERPPKMTPDDAFPIIFQVAQPCRGLDDRASLAGYRVGEGGAVGRTAIENFL